MEFQILNTEGQIISANKLDLIVAEFWGVQFEDTKYAEPLVSFGNWFDMIGFGIATNKDWSHFGTKSWNSVKVYILHIHTPAMVVLSPEEAGVEMCGVMDYLKPYFELINHFESQGFTFKQL